MAEKLFIDGEKALIIVLPQQRMIFYYPSLYKLKQRWKDISESNILQIIY